MRDVKTIGLFVILLERYLSLFLLVPKGRLWIHIVVDALDMVDPPFAIVGDHCRPYQLLYLAFDPLEFFQQVVCPEHAGTGIDLKINPRFQGAQRKTITVDYAQLDVLEHHGLLVEVLPPHEFLHFPFPEDLLDLGVHHLKDHVPSLGQSHHIREADRLDRFDDGLELMSLAFKLEGVGLDQGNFEFLFSPQHAARVCDHFDFVLDLPAQRSDGFVEEVLGVWRDGRLSLEAELMNSTMFVFKINLEVVGQASLLCLFGESHRQVRLPQRQLQDQTLLILHSF
jgi:hypothetical protein